MPITEEPRKLVHLTPNEVRPNSGAPVVPPALEWVVHPSPLPWLNSTSLWPLHKR